MPIYDRQTTVEAPLADVWEFHSRIEGLEAVTPDWMGLRVEAVIGPDGDPDPERLEAGTELSLSIRPLGVGPRQRWTTLIAARERDGDTAYFRDEMIRGPFDRWEHTHAFSADGERTVLRDHVEYDLPGSNAAGLGRLVGVAAPFSTVGFEAMFRKRHRLTKDLLE